MNQFLGSDALWSTQPNILRGGVGWGWALKHTAFWYSQLLRPTQLGHSFVGTSAISTGDGLDGPLALAGASIPQQPRRYPPTSLFPVPPHSPFPLPFSSPSLVLPSPPFLSPPFPFCRKATPLKTARGLGKRCKLPQWRLGRSPSRHRFWCILRGKNSFDSNYYMEFCVLKFVKLLNF